MVWFKSMLSMHFTIIFCLILFANSDFFVLTKMLAAQWSSIPPSRLLLNPISFGNSSYYHICFGWGLINGGFGLFDEVVSNLHGINRFVIIRKIPKYILLVCYIENQIEQQDRRFAFFTYATWMTVFLFILLMLLRSLLMLVLSNRWEDCGGSLP